MTPDQNKKINILFNGLHNFGEEGEIIESVDGLRDIAIRNSPYSEPEINLLLSIMEEAVRDRDYKFMTSYQFRSRCVLLGLNPDKIKRIIFDIWGINE